MAYLYIDDGYPEASEYSNNYIYFDDKDPDCVDKMTRIANRLMKIPAPKRQDYYQKIMASGVNCC